MKNATNVAEILFTEDEHISFLVVGQSSKFVNFLKFFTWVSGQVKGEYGPYGAGQDAP